MDQLSLDQTITQRTILTIIKGKSFARRKPLPGARTAFLASLANKESTIIQRDVYRTQNFSGDQNDGEKS